MWAKATMLLLMPWLVSYQPTSPVASLQAGSELSARVLPYGLNLGGSGSWGAEHLRANILNNPSFEATLERSIFIPQTVSGAKLTEDTAQLGRPDGFWSNGQYHVLTGQAAGQQGGILDARAGQYAQVWLNPAPQMQSGEVLVLSQQNLSQPAWGWWVKGAVRRSDERHAQSVGQQSLQLLGQHQPVELKQYFDNISDRAGKLLLVEGRWKLSFWAKASQDQTPLLAHFDRGGRQIWLSHTFNLSREWQFYQVEFSAQDTSSAAPITFSLNLPRGEVWLDEVYLGEAQVGVAGFRQAVVATLQDLQPGILRDWQGQLGDSLSNRLTSEMAHQPVRYRAGEHETQFHYSLPDFLALCAAIKAQPWVVAPTTFNDAEWLQLGAYLHQAIEQYGFKQILLEFGNENWNTIFRPAGISDTNQLAYASDRAFALLQRGSHHDARIVTVVNTQFVNPAQTRQFVQQAAHTQRIAIAPYFLYQLDQNHTIEQASLQALQQDEVLLKQQQAAAARGLSVYEVNFHTTLGNADAALRNLTVSNAASGTALARRLIQASLVGVQEQAVYSLSGFDSYLQQGQGLVRLWGITRNLNTASQLRPTGLALGLLNRVAYGTSQKISCQGLPCAQLTSISFDHQRYAIASSATHAVPLQIPCNQDKHLAWLDGSDLQRHNEDEQQVNIQQQTVVCHAGQLQWHLPAMSLLIIW